MVVSEPLPPGPPWPGLQTIRYGIDPYGFFESARRNYGDVFTVRPMGETWVILAHPDAARELLAQSPDALDSGAANQTLSPLLGTRNVLLLDGDEHLRRRRLVLPPFHGARLRAYEDLIRAATRRALLEWPLKVAAATLPRMRPARRPGAPPGPAADSKPRSGRALVVCRRVWRRGASDLTASSD